MIVELTKCTLLAAESWPRNLSHSLPKTEAMCSEVPNITSSSTKTSPVHFQHSSKYQNIFSKLFCEFQLTYKVILSLNMANMAQILNKIAFFSLKLCSSFHHLLCFIQKASHKPLGMCLTLFGFLFQLTEQFFLCLL